MLPESFTVFELHYMLTSKLRIGAYQRGFTLTTLPFIPSYTIWGALVESITKRLSFNIDCDSEIDKLYEDVKNKVLYKTIFPTSFYPINEDAIFTDSYVSTAIDNSTKSAIDESLHESEFISPYESTLKDDNLKNVVFVGYIVVKSNWLQHIDKTLNIPLETFITSIQVGADRKYGFGQLTLKEKKSVEVVFDTFCVYERSVPKKSSSVDNDSRLIFATNPTLLQSSKTIKIAPVKYFEDDQKNPFPVIGNIQPYVSRRTESSMKYGRTLSKPIVCFSPEATINDDVELSFMEDYPGILEYIKEPTSQ
jgi:hypothetical protein